MANRDLVRSRGLVIRASVALAVVAALLGAAPAAAEAQPADAGYFSDDDGSVHEPALDALAARGVLAGTECGEGLICPGAPLKRWEMAVWLVRVLDGTDPGPADASRFEDVNAELWWAPFVERLSELEVTGGCSTEPARFCPGRAVTRAQMA
ncbi:MAG: S-layer homology domain-containing protein, partial [Acidimicrobiaceae bacterium]|nr:S-layer homology domain-containing protein [Acidimicrobiaceae bacterium]MYL04585.1 S-layer homology domain-containing protein [Acidimicrobiaceae bacterium]